MSTNDPDLRNSTGDLLSLQPSRNQPLQTGGLVPKQLSGLLSHLYFTVCFPVIIAKFSVGLANLYLSTPALASL